MNLEILNGIRHTVEKAGNAVGRARFNPYLMGAASLLDLITGSVRPKMPLLENSEVLKQAMNEIGKDLRETMRITEIEK